LKQSFQQSPPFPIERLPYPVLRHVFSYLSFEERFQAERVCQVWYQQMVWPRGMDYFTPPVYMDKQVRYALVRKLGHLGYLRAANEFYCTCFKRWPLCAELKLPLLELWVNESMLNEYLYGGNPHVIALNIWTEYAGSVFEEDDGDWSFWPKANEQFMREFTGRFCPESKQPRFGLVYTVCFDCKPEHLWWWQSRFPQLQRITIWRNAECYRRCRSSPHIFLRGNLCPWPADMKRLMSEPSAVVRLETPTLSHRKVILSDTDWLLLEEHWNWLFRETLNLAYPLTEFLDLTDREFIIRPSDYVDNREKQLFSPYGKVAPNRVI
jgi:hypothetical protein